VEDLMHNIHYIIDNREIRRIAEKTTEIFIWKNKKKRPLVRTTIFDV
jgi:hypothetical protein